MKRFDLEDEKNLFAAESHLIWQTFERENFFKGVPSEVIYKKMGKRWIFDEREEERGAR